MKWALSCRIPLLGLRAVPPLKLRSFLGCRWTAAPRPGLYKPAFVPAAPRSSAKSETTSFYQHLAPHKSKLSGPEYKHDELNALNPKVSQDHLKMFHLQILFSLIRVSSLGCYWRGPDWPILKGSRIVEISLFLKLRKLSPPPVATRF